MTLIAACILGILIGWRSGVFEADWAKARADDRVYDPLPHPLLWCLRLAFALLIAVIIDGIEWRALWLVVACMAPMATAHRLIYNRRTRANGLSRTREWWYMGDNIRRIGDSWYDTVCWVISAEVARFDKDETGKRYLSIIPRHPAMPFLVAVAIEAAGLALAALIH